MLPSAKLALVATGEGICKRYQVMDFVSVGMNAASVVDEFPMLLKRVTFESSRRRTRRGNNNNKNQGEKKEYKKSYLTHVKPLNPNNNPSFIFFTERIITVKTKFLKSGSVSCLVSFVIFVCT